MARRDERLSTDDLTGRSGSSHDDARRDEGAPGARGRDDDRGRDRGGPPPAGGDIREVRTEGGRVHVERDRPAGDGPDAAGAPGGDTGRGEQRPLLADRDLEDFRRRWDEIQATFVDEPRRAVEEADALVAGVMQRLADSFSAERQDLESRWDRGDEVDTESLRVALQRYRSFFNRLLSA